MCKYIFATTFTLNFFRYFNVASNVDNETRNKQTTVFEVERMFHFILFSFPLL